MANYKIELIPFHTLEQAILLPTYQRPLVWSKPQKAKFIENLSKGFPFGSLLLYKYERDLEKYSLIDGQQRYTTILEYSKNPEEYFPIESHPYVDNVVSAAKIDKQSHEAQAHLRPQITQIIKKFLHERLRNDLSALYLFEKISEVYPAIQHSTEAMGTIVRIQEEIEKDVDQYIDLGSLELPCVIFTGKQSDLPEVFASVNLGGRKLTKYQVFKAQWNRYAIDLSSDNYSDAILEKTIQRYNELTESRQGIEIEDYSESEMRNNRQVTLPEFCRALGEMIMEACPACWPAPCKSTEDSIDTLGYNTLAIVFGIKPTNIEELPEYFDGSFLDGNPVAVEKTLGQILDEYRTINHQFARYLKKPDREQETYETSKTTGQLQFLSFFAALWRLHYTKSNSGVGFDIVERYKHRGYKESCNNLFGWFLIDALTNQWKGSGDSRLGAYVDGSRTYTSSYSKDQLLSALFDWIEQEKDQASINLDPLAKTLLTVFSNCNGRQDQYNELRYDIEHLFSRDLLNAKVDGMPRYKHYAIPGGSLGNILYLSAGLNRSKGATNLAPYAQEEYSLNRERHFLPDETELINAERALENGDPQRVKCILVKRAKCLAEEIASSL